MRQPDLEMAEWILSGVPTYEIAKRADLTEEQARRIVAGRSRPQILKHVERWRSDYIEACASRLIRAQWEALDLVITTMNNKKIHPGIRLKAAEIILNRADVRQAAERAGMPTHLIIKYIEACGAIIPPENRPQAVIDCEPLEEHDGNGNGRANHQ